MTNKNLKVSGIVAAGVTLIGAYLPLASGGGL